MSLIRRLIFGPSESVSGAISDGLNLSAGRKRTSQRPPAKPRRQQVPDDVVAAAGRVAVQEVLRRARARSANLQVGRDLQYLDDDFRVEVKSGYSDAKQTVTTDILIFNRMTGRKSHYVYDANSGAAILERP